MSSIDSSELTSAYNSMKLTNMSYLLNGGSDESADIISGISGDLLQQWTMLGANSKAYKALLAASETGSVTKTQGATELLSDKYFNDYYDPETKTYSATYTPTSETAATIDSESTAGDVLSDMRTLALAAISNPDSLNSYHYDFFETMRSSIANNLIIGYSSADGTDVTTEEATAASLSASTDFRLLTDDQTFTVAGANGEETYSFGVGTSLEDVVAAINADSSTTGVSAELVENDDGIYTINLTSTATGADQFIRVDQTTGSLFASSGGTVSASGTDAVTTTAETVATSDDTWAAMAAGMYGGKLTEDVSFTLQGRTGSQTFNFDKGTTTEDIVAAINEATSQTGVTAQVLYGSDGSVEGIGLLSEKAGSGYYVQVNQTKGSLFAVEGKTVSVAGSSSDSIGDGPAITSLSDLGQVSIDGVTYSFADLAPGGKASLANNPDAALAVLDQTIADIYSGRAEIYGFDPSSTYIAGTTVNTGAQASTNTHSYGDYGSTAIKNFLALYASGD